MSSQSANIGHVTSRKKRRGMIEKRRRDKINSSLGELRRLVPAAFEKQGSAKLEKAEILQMTVDYLRMLHARGLADTLTTSKHCLPGSSSLVSPANGNELERPDQNGSPASGYALSNSRSSAFSNQTLTTSPPCPVQYNQLQQQHQANHVQQPHQCQPTQQQSATQHQLQQPLAQHHHSSLDQSQSSEQSTTSNTHLNNNLSTSSTSSCISSTTSPSGLSQAAHQLYNQHHQMSASAFSAAAAVEQAAAYHQLSNQTLSVAPNSQHQQVAHLDPIRGQFDSSTTLGPNQHQHQQAMNQHQHQHHHPHHQHQLQHHHHQSSLLHSHPSLLNLDHHHHHQPFGAHYAAVHQNHHHHHHHHPSGSLVGDTSLLTAKFLTVDISDAKSY